MTTKYVQPGEIIDYLATADIKSNDVVVIGALIGVAATDIAQGEVGSVAIKDVFDLPKAAGAIAAGDIVSWDAASGAFSAAGTGPAAIAIADAAADDAEVRVLLVPGLTAAGATT